MEILLIFSFYLIISGTDAVTVATGYRGGSVQIKCPYRSEYENDNKYLCRGRCPFGAFKDIPVESGSPPKDRRFSLSDNKTAKVFTVTITDLRPEDANTYWCVIQQPGVNDYTEILLQVKTDVLVIHRVSHTTHTTHSTHPASTHARSSSDPAETTRPMTINPLSDANHQTTTTNIPGIVMISAGLVAVAVAVIIVTFNKIKSQGAETEESNEEENDQNVLPFQASTPDALYESVDPAPDQSDLDSLYENMTLAYNQQNSGQHPR